MATLIFIGILAICIGVLESLIKFKNKISKTFYTIGIILINAIVLVGMISICLVIIATIKDFSQIVIIVFSTYMFFTLERASNNYDDINEEYTDIF